MNPIQATVANITASFNRTLPKPNIAPKQLTSRPRPVATETAAQPKAARHRIVQGDCLDMLPKIPSASVDFICADFPYNISGKGGLTMKGSKLVKADF